MRNYFKCIILFSFSDIESAAFDSWSIVWYIASFGGLIAFFLIVSCSEWCCRRNRQNNGVQIPTLPSSSPTTSSTETPPPSYELFAPPSYESLCYNNEKANYDIFVVPVHAIRPIVEENLREDPPSYNVLNNVCNTVEVSENLSNDSHAWNK